MRPVLELHLTGQTTPDIQAALGAHLPTCAECLSVLQAYAEQTAEPAEPITDPQVAAYAGPIPSDVPLLGPNEVAAAAYLSEQELAAEIARAHAAQVAAMAAPSATASPPAPPPAPVSEDDDDASLIPRPIRAVFDFLLYGTLAIVAALVAIIGPDFLAGPEAPRVDRVAAGLKIAEVRLVRVRPDGARERMDGNVIAPGDRLGFVYVNTSDWERLMIVVTDELNEIYWQYPEWTDRRAPAYAPTILSTRKLQQVPQATHREWEGKLLTVRWIFSRDFITTREVEERLLDPQRKPTEPLFSKSFERVQLVAVDPAATEVHGLPQDDTDNPGTAPQDNYLRVDPNH